MAKLDIKYHFIQSLPSITFTFWLPHSSLLVICYQYRMTSKSIKKYFYFPHNNCFISRYLTQPLTHDMYVVYVTKYKFCILVCILTFIATTLGLCTNIHNNNFTLLAIPLKQKKTAKLYQRLYWTIRSPSI